MPAPETSSLLSLLSSPGPILSTIAGVIGALFYARKKLSSEKLERTKDRAEIDLIEALEDARDEALREKLNLQINLTQAQASARDSADQITKLQTEVTRLNSQLSLLRKLIERLSDALDLSKLQLAEVKSQQRDSKDG